MSAGGTRVETVVVVRNKNGLHARPSSMLAESAMKFECTSLTLRKGDVEVDAKSIMELLLLEATCGTELQLSADGPRAEEAIEELKRLFEAEFNVKL